MSPELEQQLIKKYPALFQDTDKPATESLMCFGCECRDGWYNIIESACGIISHYIEQRRKTNDLSSFRWMQIKEKFGTLRLYHSGDADEYILGVTDMAEDLSGSVCEVCGNVGQLCGTGWYQTLCPEHEKLLP
jgi:hypothetical protein